MTAQWHTSLLRSDRTIQEAAELLTENSLRIVLVIDEQSRLLGTVTDGDIRRSLMAGHRMTAAVTTMMQASPIALTQGDSRGKALQIMREKDLLHLPVLDSKGFVVGLETMRNLVFEAPRSNAVVLMAGGFGQRLYPLTRDVPKPLLPVGEKPILENTLEQLVDGGFSRFYFAVHYLAEQVREYFGDGTKWGIQIEYLEERYPLGTAGALSLLNRDVVDSPLLMMNGDLLTRLNFGELLDFHEKHGGLATLCVREYDFQIPYGVVQSDGMLLTEILEKPVQKCFVNAGIYVLEPSVLDRIMPDEAIDMPVILQQVLRGGDRVNMFPIHEYWLDIGRVEEYERAQADVSKMKS
jgi:dTDP-glucose pyrophosphorylase